MNPSDTRAIRTDVAQACDGHASTVHLGGQYVAHADGWYRDKLRIPNGSERLIPWRNDKSETV